MTALLSSTDIISLDSFVYSHKSSSSLSLSTTRYHPIKAAQPLAIPTTLDQVEPFSADSSLSASSSSSPVDPPKRPRMKLSLSSEQKANFISHIHESKQKFISDTAHLPKSTNMGMSDSEAAALMSTNRFNFSHDSHNWQDNDVDVDCGQRPTALSNIQQTQFQTAIPCIFVTNMSNSTCFYQKVLGFSSVGKPASHQTVLRRGPAYTPPRGSFRPGISAVPPASQESGVRIALRIRPAEWGDLPADGMGPPQLMVAVSNVDNLFKEIAAKQEQLKPKGDEYFPEVFLGKAKVLSKPQNKPWSTRELHVLDPDGNKIIFFHEL